MTIEFVVTPELKKYAQQALDVQCACNLSGVVLSYAGAVAELNKIYRVQGINLGTDRRNKCPIHILFATQVTHLALGECAGDMTAYSKATRACEALAKAEENTKVTVEW
jgi:hypothetical protein